MRSLLQSIHLSLHVWALVAAYFAIAAFVALLVRRIVAKWIASATPRMDANLAQVLARTLPRPAGAAVFLFAIGEGPRLLPLPPSVDALTKHVLPFLFGTLAVVLVMRMALAAIGAYGESHPGLRSAAGVAQAITWIVGLALVAVIVSDALGVSLAPALTALGVGSLAVALALQDTLSNFFAGVYLVLDKPIELGHFVRLEGGQEGYVEHIGWRSTRLRTLAPSAIIVPNATLSKAVLTNFGASNPRLVISVTIEVALDSDVAKAEAALGDVLAHATEIAGVQKDAPVPMLRVTMGDRGIAFVLTMRIASTADGSLVTSEVRKRAFAKLHEAGVSLAPPVAVSASKA
jgi:small-conductance mechanosensitive channel